MSESQPEVLLDLSQPRAIKLTDRGRDYTLRCRRVTEKDWVRYFSNIVVSSQQDGRERINVRDFDSARIGLAEAVLEAAEGYKVEGGADITSLDNWQSRIPLAHRLKLSDVLASARPSLAGELVIQPECELVELDCDWGLNEDGKMLRFTGLKHFFATPSEEHHRRYMREANRSFIQGGSRTGKTIYRGAQVLLIQLYDELIRKVDGYATSFNCDPLGDDRPRIIVDMDTHHKVMAAQELFQPQDTSALAEAEDAE